MTALLIDEVYNKLLHWRSCSSRSDFSTRWLGANPAYYRSIVAQGRVVSVKVQLQLAANLRTIGYAYVKSEFPYFKDRGAGMLGLYGEVWDDLITRALIDDDEEQLS